MNAGTMAEMLPGEAFLARLEAHRGILFKVSALYCANTADREDLAQEIVAQLWRSHRRFDERSRFSTWMYRVALNVAISWVREDRRRGERIASVEPGIIDATLAEAASGDLPPDLQVLFAEIIARLGKVERALLLLYLEGHDHATIAAVLGISTTNVATRIGRLRRVIETEIQP
jgi:RNA polymerase sigma-70 factor (ECF subfamily)